MKRTFITLLVLGAILAPLAHLHSQSAQPAPTAAASPSPAPATPLVITINICPQLKNPLLQLDAMKKANQAMIEQQAKTLQTLDELQKQAEELKIYGKRS